MGKTFSSVLVNSPSNASAAPHRYSKAFPYAYLLERAVRSEFEDEPPPG